MALPSGITHHWNFKDGAGTTITDIVGNADGTLNGTTTNFWDKVDINGDTVGNFNASDNDVDVPGATFPTGDWSIASLVYVENFTDFLLIYFWRSGGTGISANARAAGFKVSFGDATTNSTLPSATDGEFKQWNRQWVVVQTGYRSSDNSIYYRVNKFERTGTQAITDPGTDLVIGSNGTTNFFDGRIADVVFWDGTFLSSSQRDDAVDALLERVYGAANVTVDDSAVTKTTIALPSDGTSDGTGRSVISSQLFSTATKVYVADHTASGANWQGTVWRYSKTAGAMASSIDVGQEGTPYGADSTDFSHKAIGLGVDSGGNVYAARHRNATGFNTVQSDSANDVTAWTATHDPTSPTPDLTYSYFTLDPSGNLFFRLQDRGTGDGIFWWKWNSGTSQWDDAFASNPLFRASGTGSGGAGKLYDPWMVFSGTTIWAVASRDSSDRISGPFRDFWLLRSTDSGSNWSRPTGGAAITLPGGEDKVESLAPSSRVDAAQGDKGGLVITLDDQAGFHAASRWTNELLGDTEQSLWYHRWDDTAGYYIHRRLMTHGTEDVGHPHIGAIGSNLFIIAPANHRSAVSPSKIVYLFTSDDYGDTWTRYKLDTDANDYVSEGSLDFQGLSQDSKVRFMPLFHDAQTRAEVWEFTLPSAEEAADSDTDGVSAGVIAGLL